MPTLSIRAFFLLAILVTAASDSLLVALCWLLINGILPLTLPMAMFIAVLFPVATLSGAWLIRQIPKGKKGRF